MASDEHDAEDYIDFEDFELVDDDGQPGIEVEDQVEEVDEVEDHVDLARALDEERLDLVDELHTLSENGLGVGGDEAAEPEAKASADEAATTSPEEAPDEAAADADAVAEDLEDDGKGRKRRRREKRRSKRAKGRRSRKDDLDDLDDHADGNGNGNGDTPINPAPGTEVWGDMPAPAPGSSALDVPPPQPNGNGKGKAAPRVQGDHLPVPMDQPQLTTELSELKSKARDELIDRLGARLYDSTLTDEQLEAMVIDELAGILIEQDAKLTNEQRELLANNLIYDVLRHGAIEPYILDDTVSEIMVNGINSIYVERDGKLQLTSAKFETEEHLRQVIDRIVSQLGRRIDESSPMVDARLPDGSRVNAIIPPLAVDGPSVSIRKFTKNRMGVDELIRMKTITEDVAQLLEASVRGEMSVLVSGGTGSGKTTLLNVLSSFIPGDQRIVTIEDAVELQLRQHHVVRLEARPPNIEGKGAVEIRDLVRNSLRMRPDRIIVGECRGGEALDMLQAMNTGHDGSLSTLHANTPRDAIARLETMVLMAGMELPVRAIREQISSAIDLIVQMGRLRDGTRRVTHITEIVGMEGDVVTASDIFTFDYGAGFDIDGRYAGGLQPTGLRPRLVDRLADHGIELPAGVFGSVSLDELGVPG